MSYCRFIEADAYIYDDVYYGLYCCACSLMPLRKADMSIFGDDGDWFINEGFAAGYDYDKMLAHIAEHRAAGDYIPEDVDERLIEERDCEHIFVDMKFGIRCEKCWKPEDDK
jgi:hypothetical protein